MGVLVQLVLNKNPSVLAEMINAWNTKLSTKAAHQYKVKTATTIKYHAKEGNEARYLGLSLEIVGLGIDRTGEANRGVDDGGRMKIPPAPPEVIHLRGTHHVSASRSMR